MEESVEATPSLIHSAGWINPLSFSFACLSNPLNPTAIGEVGPFRNQTTKNAVERSVFI